MGRKMLLQECLKDIHELSNEVGSLTAIYVSMDKVNDKLSEEYEDYLTKFSEQIHVISDSLLLLNEQIQIKFLVNMFN